MDDLESLPPAPSPGSPVIQMEDGTLACRSVEDLDVGDLDQQRNLKIRTFVRLGLRPLFDDLQDHLRFKEMGQAGIAPGQYYEDFEAVPGEFGYDRRFQTELTIRLRRARIPGPRGAVERLVIETAGCLKSAAATGPSPAIGFDPPLGALSLAGRSRVLHLLTKPANPPGERQVTEVPDQLAELSVRPFDGGWPTMASLRAAPSDHAAVAPESDPVFGVWGIANSDVFAHVHAREYLYAMENRLAGLLYDAGLALDRFSPTRARVIFRRPSLVGERYALRSRLFHRTSAAGGTVVAVGSFHRITNEGIDDRPATGLRFEGLVGESGC